MRVEQGTTLGSASLFTSLFLAPHIRTLLTSEKACLLSHKLSAIAAWDIEYRPYVVYVVCNSTCVAPRTLLDRTRFSVPNDDGGLPCSFN